jgi:Phytanoyl-CoA dioxygenase (PhyH)
MNALETSQIEHFVERGYVRLDEAFPRSVAERGCEILWRDTGCDPLDRSTWTRPVIWLWDYDQEPFRQAVNMPRLHSAFDQLVGKGRWLPRQSLGTFPVRFPSQTDTGDTGWHVDASFPGEDSRPNDFLSWRVNVRSRGRALLMLFLFSDVGEPDAPTRIRAGSHLEVARMLELAGEPGLRPGELDYGRTAGSEEVLATGAAGTVYLCHPFLVHAAQVNRGTHPRFMAQPPLLPTEPLCLDRTDATAYSPVERAIRRGLERQRQTCATHDVKISPRLHMPIL